MSKTKLMALAVMMTIAAHVADAASPKADQANAPAQSKEYAQENPELSLTPAQGPAATSQDTNPWATTQSGVNIQSRAGFVGYH